MADRHVYLTQDGYERLAQELTELRSVKRPSIEERIRLAKEFADTVDNAEFDSVKQEQAFVEGRIQELEQLLADVEMIDAHPVADFVKLGAHVTVVGTDDEQEVYTIVGSAEADPKRGFVSNESPVGRALLGRKVGDVVTVIAPGGSFTVRIVALA
ncbi:MAG: transcription elongation factor GreA [Chloroflexota bacterium]